MNRDSELSPLLPTSVTKVSNSLKRAGQIGFWTQIVLGVISAVTLLFASPVLIENKERTQGTGFGIFSALVGIILLGIAIYFSSRYSSIARKIQNPDPTSRPRKSDTIQIIKIGLMINLAGMLMAIIGAEALVGLVLAKSLSRPQLALGSNPTEFVNSIDLLVIQANTNVITAHFAGILSSLWLLNRINR